MLLTVYDEFGLGGAPCEEDCVQVTRDGDYHDAMRAECRRYAAFLEAYFGAPPEGAWFRVKGYPHEFGTYYEVEVRFDTEDEAACAYAYRCEANLPARWDSLPPATWR